MSAAAADAAPGATGAAAPAAALARLTLDAPAASVSDSSWGPPAACMFAEFDGTPFRLFSRSAKVGKVADFGGYLRPMMRGRFSRAMGEQHSELDIRGDGGPEEDGDGAFVRVDTTKTVPRPRMGGQRRPHNAGGPPGGRGGGGGGGGRPVDASAGGEMGNKGKIQTGSSFNKRFNKLTRARFQSDNRGGKPGGPHGHAPRTLREFSVKIQPDWLQLETLDLAKVRGRAEGGGARDGGRGARRRARDGGRLG